MVLASPQAGNILGLSLASHRQTAVS